MIPFRPYKVQYDIVTDAKKIFTFWITINLFDVKGWSECSNELEEINDTFPRTIVRLSDRSFIMRVAYNEFEQMILQMKKEYGLFDDRTMVPPDRLKYRGPIQVNIANNKDALAITFHRKGFKPTTYDDFAYHAIFSNINPMN